MLVPDVSSLGLQIAQTRYYLLTLEPKVGHVCILGALGVGLNPGFLIEAGEYPNQNPKPYVNPNGALNPKSLDHQIPNTRKRNPKP